MSSKPVQILYPEGYLAPPESWFPEGPDSLPEEPFFIVAIMGPQASGKSTLVNALFETSFPVADRNQVGIATTRGIFAERASDTDTPTLVLDVEGADARARAREAKDFSWRSASFVSALADVVIVNLWFHDACRLDSASYMLIRAVLNSSAQSHADDSPARTALIVAVRDVDDDAPEATSSLRDLITSDIQDIWEDVVVERGLPVGEGGMPLSEAIDVHVSLFPHFRHEIEAFEKEVSSLRTGLFDGTLAKEEHSKQVPGDGVATYAQSLWESLRTTHPNTNSMPGTDFYPGISSEEVYTGEDFAIVAGYRCDEAFSDKLAEGSEEIANMLDQVEEGNRIDNLGQKADDVVNRTLQGYDEATTDYVDEPVYERKRKELEVILDTALNTVFMKNVSIIGREALSTFKSSVAGEIPADFALHSTDNKFVKMAKESVRPGSGWSFESERMDLLNMMKEIAAQQRKLIDTKMNASNLQSKAIHFLRLQHAQMQAVQQQALGGGVGQWNLGAAYRPPDSNVNLSLAYQQGRTNLQVSMVPDESSSLLGPSGFTAGVGPGNLGLSLNVNF